MRVELNDYDFPLSIMHVRLKRQMDIILMNVFAVQSKVSSIEFGFDSIRFSPRNTDEYYYYNNNSTEN